MYLQKKSLPQLRSEVVNHIEDDPVKNKSVLPKDKSAATSKLDVCMNIEQTEATAMKKIVGNQLDGVGKPNEVVIKL